LNLAIALTLFFFGLATASSGWRVIMALERAKSPWRWVAIPLSGAVVVWCFYGAYWMLQQR